MSSYAAHRNLPALLLLALASLLGFSPSLWADSATAAGNGASASASLNFRIVIPGRLRLSVGDAVDGQSTLNVHMHSRRGPLTINADDGAGGSALARLGDGDILKTASMQTRGGIYTVASP